MFTATLSASPAAVVTDAEPAEPKLPEGVEALAVPGGYAKLYTQSAEAPGLVRSNFRGTITLVAAQSSDGTRVDGWWLDSAKEVDRFFSRPEAMTFHFISFAPVVASNFNDYWVKEIYPTFADNPWMAHDWFRFNMLRWIEALPRPSDTVNGLIAYFQSGEKRGRNIRTPIKPGKFLQKFFADILSQDEIQKYALEWQNHHALRAVTITQDADEIEEVYKSNHNGSCMWFGSDNYAGPEHPARAYAGPDLGIAYIGSRDDADARCLVWPEKKIYYAKWYGDGPRLEAALKAQGYASADNLAFDGARLQRIPHRGAFVVPYVDVTPYAHDDGEHLILGRGEVYLRQTHGLNIEMADCEVCDEIVSPDLAVTDYLGNSVCPDCRNEHYFLCEIADEYYPDERMAPTPGQYTVADRSVENSSAWFFCDQTELYYPHAAYTAVELLEGGTCLESHAKEYGFHCAFLDLWTLEAETALTLSDGSKVCWKATGYGDVFTTWLADRGATLGTVPHPDQLDLLMAA